jgi:hypothetical protein
MPSATWYGDGVAWTDFPKLAVDFHLCATVKDVIDFLGLPVVVGRRAGASRKPSFCQALLFDARVAMRQQFTDFRPVFRPKRGNVIDVVYVHCIQQTQLQGG